MKARIEYDLDYLRNWSLAARPADHPEDDRRGAAEAQCLLSGSRFVVARGRDRARHSPERRPFALAEPAGTRPRTSPAFSALTLLPVAGDRRLRAAPGGPRRGGLRRRWTNGARRTCRIAYRDAQRLPRGRVRRRDHRGAALHAKEIRMCGIVAAVARRNVVPILIEGLQAPRVPRLRLRRRRGDQRLA